MRMMSKRSTFIRALALATTLGLAFVEAGVQDESSSAQSLAGVLSPEDGVTEDPTIPGDSKDEEDEEEHERVLAKWDGTNIALCILGIMTALIAITCLFEQVKENIYEATQKSSLPIVDALFSEMTVLGFLSMVTFIVASEGFITDLSVRVFGDTEEGQDYLKELFEKAHYMLFLVMVIFFVIAIAILDMNNHSIELLQGLRDKVLRPDYHVAQLAIARRDPPSLWRWNLAAGLAAKNDYRNACEFLEYLSMRREFIHGRKGTEPHDELDEEDWLPLDFDYAKYLSINLGRVVAEMIDVDVWTWVQLWCLNVVMWCLLLAFPPVGEQCLVVCGVWTVLGYLEAWFIVAFYNKVREVRWCLTCPAEVPHIEFAVNSNGLPTAQLRSKGVDSSSLEHSKTRLTAQGTVTLVRNGSADDERHEEGYSVGRVSGGSKDGKGGIRRVGSGHYNVSVEMTNHKKPATSGANGGVSDNRRTRPQDPAQRQKSLSTHQEVGTTEHVSSLAAATELMAEDVMAMNAEHIGGRPHPPWASIKVNLTARGWWTRYVGGRAPYKQLLMYWHEGHAPRFHLTILRLHLVFTAIMVCLLALVFAPLIKEHFGNRWYFCYLCSPLPHLLYTVGHVLAPLTRLVTEVGCHGILSDKKTVKEVLRMMKTEKSVKGIMMLTNMKHFVSENRRKKKASKKIKALKAKQAKKDGRDDGSVSLEDFAPVGRKPSEHGEGGEKDSFGMSEETKQNVLTELFEQKFDTLQDGFCDLSEFGAGLASLGAFTDQSDVDIAFDMADVRQSKRIDIQDFTKLVKKFTGPKKEWSKGLEGKEFNLGARLSASFGGYLTKKMAKEGGELSAEEEMALLYREHGRVIHELVLLFDQYDLNADGTLDFDEVRKMVGALGEDLSDVEAKSLVAHLDRDGDGDVSLAEFVVWAFKRQQDTSAVDVEELAGEIFDEVFDDTQDGKIDVNEFIIGLERVKSELTYDEKHDLFREADDNGGGYIDREEFVALIMKYS